MSLLVNGSPADLCAANLVAAAIEPATAASPRTPPTGASPRTPPAAIRRWRRVGIVRPLSPLLAVALWQVASVTGLLPTRLLASPLTVLDSAWALTLSGALPQALLVSVQRVAVGFSVGAVIGVALGLFTGLSRWADQLLDPVLQMLRTLPFLGLVPLLILWFGIGELPKVVLVAFGTTFPLYLNTYSGIHAVDRRLIEAATVLRLGRWQRIWHVVLPGALPQVLVGLRQGLGVAWLSLIVAEQVNADTGLGQMIMEARDFLRTDVIVVGLLVYALLGLITDAAVRAVERKALAWRR
jgi:sulfonate transport system permease protein